MKKKIYLLNIFVFLSFVCIHAQMSYYYKGEKIPLTVDRNYVHLIADDDFLNSSASNQLFRQFNMERDEHSRVQGMLKIKFKSVPEMSEYAETIEFLKQHEHISCVLPFFERGNNTYPIGTSDIFYLKLKDENDVELLKKVAEQKNVRIVEQIQYMPLWYTLSVKNSAFANSIDATNYFYETGQFYDIDPAFMFDFKPNCAGVNDPPAGRHIAKLSDHLQCRSNHQAICNCRLWSEIYIDI